MLKLIVLILSFSVCGFAQISGKGVGISDGDTITVLSEKVSYKIRLAGIDAPEKGQAFGDRAKEMAELIPSRYLNLGKN